MTLSGISKTNFLCVTKNCPTAKVVPTCTTEVRVRVFLYVRVSVIMSRRTQTHTHTHTHTHTPVPCRRIAGCLYLDDIRFLVTEVDVKELEPKDKGLKTQFNGTFECFHRAHMQDIRSHISSIS